LKIRNTVTALFCKNNSDSLAEAFFLTRQAKIKRFFTASGGGAAKETAIIWMQALSVYAAECVTRSAANQTQAQY